MTYYTAQDLVEILQAFAEGLRVDEEAKLDPRGVLIGIRREHPGARIYRVEALVDWFELARFRDPAWLLQRRLDNLRTESDLAFLRGPVIVPTLAQSIHDQVEERERRRGR